MHEPITEFPKGTVIGAARLVKGDQVIDVTRLKFGSRTRFVEKVTHQSARSGSRVTALRKSDDFPSDKIASRFIGEWLHQIQSNRKYNLIFEDPQFSSFDPLAEKRKQRQRR